MILHAILSRLIEPSRLRFVFRCMGAYLGCICFLLIVSGATAFADVGVVLNDSLDTSVARFTESGHSAVYLSRICPESPVKVRLCRPDEAGSVISTYINLGEDQSFAWNVVPLNVYLYGVEDARNRPLFGTHQIKHLLEEKYRESFLSSLCQGASCQKNEKAEWREMVGAALSRNIYIFIADTSVQQDLALIAKLNALSNEDHFNVVTRNCADFAKDLINTYFPLATRADYINDFGIASPKAIARFFSRYSLRHPDSHFRVVHVAQVPGDIKESTDARMATEQLTHSFKLVPPLLLVAAHAFPVIAISYELTGRFDPEREFEKHPAADASDVAFQEQPAKNENGNCLTPQMDDKPQQLMQAVASNQEWKRDRTEYNSAVNDAVRQEIIPDQNTLKKLFKRLDLHGTPSLDTNGQLWMAISDEGITTRVGLTAGNLLASGSDPQMAYAILLARMRIVFKSPKRRREPLAELHADLDLLQHVQANSAHSDAPPSDVLLTHNSGGNPERILSWMIHLLS